VANIACFLKIAAPWQVPNKANADGVTALRFPVTMHGNAKSMHGPTPSIRLLESEMPVVSADGVVSTSTTDGRQICMPCSMVSSDGVALGPVSAGQAGCGV